MSIQSLPGFREFYPSDCAIRNHLFKVWRNAVRTFGFQEYDAPLLEPLELFTEKSGPEITSQLFHFIDRGDRAIALRPEMTPSLVRLVANKAHSLKKPIKWFSIGEQFRFERPQKGRLRSFYQLNVDILGEPSIYADAEIIASLAHILLSFGLSPSDFSIFLSDRDLWFYLLKHWNVNPTQIPTVLTIIDKLQKEDPSSILKELTPFFSSPDTTQHFFNQIHLLSRIQSLPELTSFIHSLQITDPLNKEAITNRLNDWTSLIHSLTQMGLQNIVKINLSIVRGLAYYTGFVFEAFENNSEARALAGGGRYNDLMEKLKGPSMPAVGFAIGDVTLTNLLISKQLLPTYIDSPDVFIAVMDDNALALSLEDIMTLRRHNIRVEYPLKSTSFSKQMKLANELNSKLAILYTADELTHNQVKIKNLHSREETVVSREHLVEAITDLLQKN